MSKMVSRAEWARIKSDYGFRRNASGFEVPADCAQFDDWQKVYCEGCDSKYGTIMVSHGMRAWRHPTFDEFYGGAAVD